MALRSLVLAGALAFVAAEDDCQGLVGPPVKNDTTLSDAEKNCWVNTYWAKEVGIKEHPEWYVPHGLTEESDYADFQRFLYNNSGNHTGPSYNCTDPCAAAGSSSAMPWWAWVLLTLGICCLGPALCLACMCFCCYEMVEGIFGKKEPKKNKRSIKKLKPSAQQPQGQQMQMMPAPVATQMQPVPMYQLAPGQPGQPGQMVYAAPGQYAQQQPMYYQQPGYAPMPMPAQQPVYQQVPTYAQQPPQQQPQQQPQQ
eukprot:CAMPEP_0170591810 /NCGR_PEP_ID=MMETSP0224-20130122/12599_1 /TAXON_ID=285029 /ORGANISM="Togula jolla, Strain CCCM 725" /LENGTH=253 /DNA_ID=CAMNT_0010915693 /DNA_START=72 /DNA_END=833 /DNA_ORIENTATION=-